MFLKGTLAAGALAVCSPLISVRVNAAGRTAIHLQLGWQAGGNQIGEIVAKRLGFYEQAGLELMIEPGGPNSDGVALVASNRALAGQAVSSPSLMLAASQGIPVSCFAVGLQQHPYCFFSLQKNPVHKPGDLIGKTIGIQATGMVLLDAMLKKNGIDKSQLKTIPVGLDLNPLLTGQVDVITSWQSNTTALRALGPERVDLRLWDAGVRLYAMCYYATHSTLQEQAPALQAFVAATAQGWHYARSNVENAVDLLVQEYPNLNRTDELEAAKVMLGYAFNATTDAKGWGTMDGEVWKQQVNMYAELGAFKAQVPSPESLYTLAILDATVKERMAS
jgi:NitT/TauT family transport system substrate-binding protein